MGAFVKQPFSALSTRSWPVAPPAAGDPENPRNRVGLIVNLLNMEVSIEEMETYELLFPILDDDDKCEFIYL